MNEMQQQYQLNEGRGRNEAHSLRVPTRRPSVNRPSVNDRRRYYANMKLARANSARGLSMSLHSTRDRSNSQKSSASINKDKDLSLMYQNMKEAFDRGNVMFAREMHRQIQTELESFRIKVAILNAQVEKTILQESKTDMEGVSAHLTRHMSNITSSDEPRFRPDKNLSHEQIDMYHRLELTKQILSTCSQLFDQSQTSSPDLLRQLAKQIEISLYHNACSLDEYMNIGTLRQRIRQITVQISQRQNRQREVISIEGVDDFPGTMESANNASTSAEDDMSGLLRQLSIDTMQFTDGYKPSIVNSFRTFASSVTMANSFKTFSSESVSMANSFNTFSMASATEPDEEGLPFIPSGNENQFVEYEAYVQQLPGEVVAAPNFASNAVSGNGDTLETIVSLAPAINTKAVTSQLAGTTISNCNVRSTDVLFGIGAANHPGNIRLKKLILESFDGSTCAFHNSERWHTQVVRAITMAGGRFLKPTKPILTGFPTDDTFWIEINAEEARREEESSTGYIISNENIRPDDVLLGSNLKSRDHVGNTRLQTLVLNAFVKSQVPGTKTRNDLGPKRVGEIIEYIASTGGRFLRQIHAGTNVWFEVFEEEAQKEVKSIALRITAEDDIRPEDLLLGQSPKLRDHPGNVKLRKLVADKYEEYYASGKKQKTKLAEDILESLDGRFLKQTKHNKTLWMELTDNLEVRNKVASSFRDEKKRQLLLDQNKQRTSLAAEQDKIPTSLHVLEKAK